VHEIFFEVFGKKINKITSTKKEQMEDYSQFSSFLEDIEFEDQIEYIGSLPQDLKRVNEIELQPNYSPDNSLKISVCLFSYLENFLHDKDLVNLAMASKSTLSIVREILKKPGPGGKKRRQFKDVYVYYITPCELSNWESKVVVFEDQNTRDSEYKSIVSHGYEAWKSDEVRLVIPEEEKKRFEKPPYHWDEWDKDGQRKIQTDSMVKNVAIDLEKVREIKKDIEEEEFFYESDRERVQFEMNYGGWNFMKSKQENFAMISRKYPNFAGSIKSNKKEVKRKKDASINNNNNSKKKDKNDKKSKDYIDWMLEYL
jgi:hypothetical protein